MPINFCHLHIIDRPRDYGIFILKWMELMAQYISIHEMTQERAAEFRTQMVVELYIFTVMEAKDFTVEIDKNRSCQKSNEK